MKTKSVKRIEFMDLAKGVCIYFFKKMIDI